MLESVDPVAIRAWLEPVPHIYIGVDMTHAACGSSTTRTLPVLGPGRG